MDSHGGRARRDPEGAPDLLGPPQLAAVLRQRRRSRACDDGDDLAGRSCTKSVPKPPTALKKNHVPKCFFRTHRIFFTPKHLSRVAGGVIPRPNRFHAQTACSETEFPRPNGFHAQMGFHDRFSLVCSSVLARFVRFHVFPCVWPRATYLI